MYFTICLLKYILSAHSAKVHANLYNAFTQGRVWMKYLIDIKY